MNAKYIQTTIVIATLIGCSSSASHYLDPLVFDYDTIAKNPEFSDSSGGAYTGVLDVKSGDTLEWECRIVNDSDTTLTYINEVKAGEMCNLWGASVDTKIESLQADENPF